MDPQSLLKALLINAAYEGASAVCTPLQHDDGKPLPIDPLLQDASLQKKGVLVYEEAKVQYNALLRAFHDKSGIWPDPKVPMTASATGSFNWPALAAQAISLLGKLPRETAIGTIGQLLDLLAVPVGSITAPGQELKS